MKQRLAKLTNLQQRVIAAVAGVPFILFMIWYADWTFALLFCVVSALTQREFYRLLGLDGFEPLNGLWHGGGHHDLRAGLFCRDGPDWYGKLLSHLPGIVHDFPDQAVQKTGHEALYQHRFHVSGYHLRSHAVCAADYSGTCRGARFIP